MGRHKLDIQNELDVDDCIKNIKFLLQTKRKTLMDIENECGISDSTLSAFLCGERRNINIDTILTLSKYFEVSLDELFNLKYENKVNEIRAYKKSLDKNYQNLIEELKKTIDKFGGK